MNSKKRDQGMSKVQMASRSVAGAIMMIAALLMIGQVAEAKRAKSSSTSSAPNPLIAPIPKIYQSPPPIPASAKFSISNGTTSPSEVAAGQTVAMRFTVRSPIAATNVLVRVYVIDGSGATDVIDIPNLVFKAGETKSLAAYFKPLASRKIGTKFWAVDVFHKGSLVAKRWASQSRTGSVITMKFRQTTGLPIF